MRYCKRNRRIETQMNDEQIIRLPKKIGAIEMTALDIFEPPI